MSAASYSRTSRPRTDRVSYGRSSAGRAGAASGYRGRPLRLLVSGRGTLLRRGALHLGGARCRVAAPGARGISDGPRFPGEGLRRHPASV